MTQSEGPMAQDGTAKRILVFVLVGIVLVVVCIVVIARLNPWDPWRPGTTHAGVVNVGGYVGSCSTFEVVGETPEKIDLNNRPRGLPWIAATDLGSSNPSGSPRVSGTLNITDDASAIFTTNDGRQWRFHRALCPPHL